MPNIQDFALVSIPTSLSGQIDLLNLRLTEIKNILALGAPVNVEFTFPPEFYSFMENHSLAITGINNRLADIKNVVETNGYVHNEINVDSNGEILEEDW